jgi:hypothetical protein
MSEQQWSDIQRCPFCTAPIAAALAEAERRGKIAGLREAQTHAYNSVIYWRDGRGHEASTKLHAAITARLAELDTPPAPEAQT